MTKRTCKVSDCSRSRWALDLCGRHYHSLRRYGDAMEVDRPGRCKHCRKPYSGRRRKFCSPVCASESRSLARDSERLSTVLVCRQCGDGFFTEKSLGRLYCSAFCSRKWQRENNPSICELDGCDAVVKARMLCAKHYTAWRRAEGLDTWKDEWTPARKAHYHLRRARKRGVDAEKVVSLRVFERDGWLCGICGELVDSAVKWPDSMSPSLDHIVPLSRGGAHTYENTRLAHVSCNVSKSNALDSELDYLKA